MKTKNEFLMLLLINEWAFYFDMVQREYFYFTVILMFHQKIWHATCMKINHVKNKIISLQ